MLFHGIKCHNILFSCLLFYILVIQTASQTINQINMMTVFMFLSLFFLYSSSLSALLLNSSIFCGVSSMILLLIPFSFRTLGFPESMVNLLISANNPSIFFSFSLIMHSSSSILFSYYLCITLAASSAS